jgi:colanic acid biosynthesis glycosyl transferase WcaI
LGAASVDEAEVARVVQRAECGLAVPPDDPDAFLTGLRRLLADSAAATEMGERGRRFVERWASPVAVAVAYETLFAELSSAAGRPVGQATAG